MQFLHILLVVAVALVASATSQSSESESKELIVCPIQCCKHLCWGTQNFCTWSPNSETDVFEPNCRTGPDAPEVCETNTFSEECQALGCTSGDCVPTTTCPGGHGYGWENCGSFM